MSRRSPFHPRRRGSVRLRCEPLEGRAMLATSSLDRSFGTDGVVVGALNFDTDPTFDVVAAIVVQGDGKTITAETNTPSGGSPSTNQPLTIRRYNTDGSLDTTFGTDGQTSLPFSVNTNLLATQPKDLILTANDQILVAAEASSSATEGTATKYQDVVARLTSTGTLDATFGTGGVAVLPDSVRSVNSVGVEPGGRVVVAGSIPASTGDNTNAYPEAVVIGLTSAGALDSSFGAGGEAVVPLATASLQIATDGTLAVIGLRITSTGQILLGTDAITPPTFANGLSQPSDASTLSRLTADGTIDTTFGSGGTLFVGGSIPQLDAFDVDPAGFIVVAGAELGSPQYPSFSRPVVARLRADGTFDPNFTPPTLSDSTASFVAVTIVADSSITALTSDSDLYRFTDSGVLDTQFGRAGMIQARFPESTLPANTALAAQVNTALALSPSGSIVTGGAVQTRYTILGTGGSVYYSMSFLARYLPNSLRPSTNDYNGDGRSDFAAELSQFGAFAYRLGTSGDTNEPFGIAGADQTIPAPGDYDGDGTTDVAAYLPALGILAYRPSSSGADVYVRFGPTGVGVAIPAPGDYDGDGKTDVALYLPGSGTFIIDPSGSGVPYAIQFGAAGAGNSIPVPGDYDGDGRTDLAVYLPSLGVLAYRPSAASASSGDTDVPFGLPGAGNTIPAPGDYDGDGRTDIAAYLPTLGVYVYRASSGTGDVLTRFGPTGLGNALPVPGDYDGDGRSDIALFLPGSATYAIDPSDGGVPYAVQFGAAGAGNTVPATTVVISQNTVSALSLAASDAGPAVGVADVPLTDDLIADLAPRRSASRPRS